jgi:hypothetical protein
MPVTDLANTSSSTSLGMDDFEVAEATYRAAARGQAHAFFGQTSEV